MEACLFTLGSLILKLCFAERTLFEVNDRYDSKRLFENSQLGAAIVHNGRMDVCARRCVSNTRCSLFSVNSNEGTCRMYEDVLQGYVVNAEPAPGLKYFLYTTETCKMESNFMMFRETNMCIKLMSQNYNFFEAEDKCQSEHQGRGLVLEDEDKANAVISALDRKGLRSHIFAIGARRVSGVFVWDDGRNVTRDWWGNNQPSHTGPNAQDCLAVYYDKLHDIWCHDEYRYMCEIPL